MSCSGLNHRCLAALIALVCFGAVGQNPALAQGFNPFQTTPLLSPFNQVSGPFQIAQSVGSTVLPTDVVPTPGGQDRTTFNRNMTLRLLQRLPSKFYVLSVVETTFRNESNVFQTAPKRSILFENPPLAVQTPEQQAQELKAISLTSQNDNVFRVLPNLTAGYAFTPQTRAFANYFLIRDSLISNSILSSTTQSVGGGLQHDIPLNQQTTMQLTAQFRELFQNGGGGQIPVFDYLPTATLYYNFSKLPARAYASALLQLRGKQPFVAPNREIDPFYVAGILARPRFHGGLYQITSQATFVQNFREPFGHNAQIRQNNYAWILDFELARQFKRFPQLQALVRAEPIYNFHSNTVPGISGFDFRIFYGFRLSLQKLALTEQIKSIREQLEGREVKPPPPLNPQVPPKKVPPSSVSPPVSPPGLTPSPSVTAPGPVSVGSPYALPNAVAPGFLLSPVSLSSSCVADRIQQ